jgi:iron complex transport system substrate-binding protein
VARSLGRRHSLGVELIEMAGGRDVFAENQASRGDRTPRGARRGRRDRIILASWCGKPVDVKAIAGRAGWAGITAVSGARSTSWTGRRSGPWPSLMHGLRRIHEIIQAYLADR